MTDHTEKPSDEYVGKTFEEDLAELDREVAERRADDDFQPGDKGRLAEDAPVLDRQKHGGD